MTKYGRPPAVVPASRTRAMLGWSISARACRSASKRAMTCFESIPALMSLTATSRLTGSVCWAIHTAPIPFADLFEQLVRANHRAGDFGDRFIDRDGRRLVETADLRLGLQQRGDPPVQILVISARFLQIPFPLIGGQLDGGEEDIACFSGAGIHGIASAGLY